MAIYRSAAQSLRGMGDSDWGDTAVGVANSSGLTAFITGIFGGKASAGNASGSSSSSGLFSGSGSSSSSSAWPWIAGLGAGAVGLTLLLRKK